MTRLININKSLYNMASFFHNSLDHFNKLLQLEWFACICIHSSIKTFFLVTLNCMCCKPYNWFLWKPMLFFLCPYHLCCLQTIQNRHLFTVYEVNLKSFPNQIYDHPNEIVMKNYKLQEGLVTMIWPNHFVIELLLAYATNNLGEKLPQICFSKYLYIFWGNEINVKQSCICIPQNMNMEEEYFE